MLSRSPFEKSPFNGILGLLFVFLVIYVLFNIVSWIVWLMYKVGWLLVIAAAIIDSSVVTGYVNSIGRLFRRNWIMGLAAGALSVALYPFVGAYMLGMALFKKKVRERAAAADEQLSGRYTDYEEIVDDPLDLDDNYEQLPPPPEPEPRRTDRGKETRYDDLFE